MKLDFSTKLLSLKGEPIVDDGTDFTLGAAAAHALLASYTDETNLPGADKARRYKIALKVFNGGEHDLEVEHVAEIKRLVAKAFSPLIVGRAYEIIDGVSAV